MSATEAAARYAGLAAIETGITAAKRQAADELRAIADAAGLTKGEVTTPFGPVTLSENKAHMSVVVVDESEFVAWVAERSPDSIEVVRRVRQGDRDAILARLVAVAGAVVDSSTGETVEFARVEQTEAAPPTPSYRASVLQREAKRAAIGWASARAASLVAGVRAEITDGSGQ